MGLKRVRGRTWGDREAHLVEIVEVLQHGAVAEADAVVDRSRAEIGTRQVMWVSGLAACEIRDSNACPSASCSLQPALIRLKEGTSWNPIASHSAGAE